MKNNPVSLWRIEVAATALSVSAFEEALDPFCESISRFVTDSEGEWSIKGFTERKPEGLALAAVMTDVASELSISVPEVMVIPVAPCDWVASSLRMFSPTEAGRFFIYGTHYDMNLPPSRIPICLNPGRAFGSGEHATTMGCLLALSDLIGWKNVINPLDMGCGSGILSIAIAKAWRVQVYGMDLETNAVQVARENSRRNGVGLLVRIFRSNGYHSSLVKKNGPYDLIVSNILANPLCKMAKAVGARSRSRAMGGGIVILGGFLEIDANRVYVAYYRQGFRLIRSYLNRGWRTLVLRR
jgi:ribosomal protein L11 methyltransferase